MSSLTNAFTPSTMLGVAYSMLAVTGSVFVARIVLQVQKAKWPTVSDYCVFLGFAFHIAMCGMYIAVVPLMKRVYFVLDGKGPPYPGFDAERIKMAKLFFAAISMFFTVLWSIKFSLLFLYRRLLTGVNKFYTMIWWAILVVCIAVSIAHVSIKSSQVLTITDAHCQLRSIFHILWNPLWLLEKGLLRQRRSRNATSKSLLLFCCRYHNQHSE